MCHACVNVHFLDTLGWARTKTIVMTSSTSASTKHPNGLHKYNVFVLNTRLLYYGSKRAKGLWKINWFTFLKITALMSPMNSGEVFIHLCATVCSSLLTRLSVVSTDYFKNIIQFVRHHAWEILWKLFLGRWQFPPFPHSWQCLKAFVLG